MPSEPSLASVIELRRALEKAFSPDTAVLTTAWSREAPSTGHCAAVAAILHVELGAELWSGAVDGTSHWFNAVHADGERVFLDLTGDQFGRPAVQLWRSGEIYDQTVPRKYGELNEETLRRASRLADRAGLRGAAATLSTSPTQDK